MANCRPIPCENFFEFVGIKDNLPKLKQVKFLLCMYSHVVEKQCFDFTVFARTGKKVKYCKDWCLSLLHFDIRLKSLSLSQRDLPYKLNKCDQIVM